MPVRTSRNRESFASARRVGGLAKVEAACRTDRIGVHFVPSGRSRNRAAQNGSIPRSRSAATSLRNERSTEGGTRTLTPVRTADFESAASAIPPLRPVNRGVWVECSEPRPYPRGVGRGRGAYKAPAAPAVKRQTRSQAARGKRRTARRVRRDAIPRAQRRIRRAVDPPPTMRRNAIGERCVGLKAAFVLRRRN